MTIKPDAIIQSYYQAIDSATHDNQGNFAVRESYINPIMGLFDTNAVYTRKTMNTDADVYTGNEAIKEFFLQKRRLVGQHNITDITVSTSDDGLSQVKVNGVYHGKSYALTPPETQATSHYVRLPFKDEFCLDVMGKITARTSHIYSRQFIQNLPVTAPARY